MNNPDLKIGTIIGSRYTLLKKLGEGGMSVVFEAKDASQDRNIAIKFLKPANTSAYIEDRIRFKKEVENISKLNHPYILKVYGLGEADNIPYIIMELYEGETLYELLNKGEIFDIDKTTRVIKQISRALNYVHSMGIIHRDLKPGNIMVNKKTKDIKLLDFGLSQVMELEAIKTEKEIVGTFGYMSPEATGIIHKPIYERSDLYSLGIIFYRLITGELPFKGNSASKIIHQQVAVTPQKPSKLIASVPKELDSIIMKLLEKEPELRYQSAAGLIHDLERFEKGDKDFIIGEHDQKIKLTYRVRFTGRNDKLTKLMELFDETAFSKGHLCLISGEPGLGKTRLAEETRGYIYEHNGLFF